MHHWQVLDYSPKGFRAPGWGVNEQSAKAIGTCFDWVAAHDLINKGIDPYNSSIVDTTTLDKEELIRLIGDSLQQ